MRKVCPHCREEYRPDPEEFEAVGLPYDPGVRFYRGSGCPMCFGTGYRGRTGVFEILVIDRALRSRITGGATREELKDAIEEKLSPWGIDIIDVEVRDIVVPKELQEAMAMEAVAERKKNARMVLAEAEKDISEMLKDASEVYAGDQGAMKLRTMHLAYESVEQSGGTLVIPSAFSEGFAPETGGAATAGRPAAGE